MLQIGMTGAGVKRNIVLELFWQTKKAAPWAAFQVLDFNQ